jgi:hypothetical protein
MAVIVYGIFLSSYINTPVFNHKGSNLIALSNSYLLLEGPLLNTTVGLSFHILNNS